MSPPSTPPPPRSSSLLRSLRIGWRCLLILLLNLLLVPFFLPIGYLAYLHDEGRVRAEWAKRARQRLQLWWAGGLIRILNVRADISGDLPDSSFFLVSNHLSYLDILLYLSMRPVVFVSKAEVAKWPVMGIMAKAAGTVFVDRTTRSDVPRVNALMEKALSRGDSVVLFPEGTTSRGEGLLRFKSALLTPIIGTKRSIVYAALSYRTPENALPAEEAVCWWGGMTLGGHLPKLIGLPVIYATVTFGTYTPPPDADRKAVGQALQNIIAEHFIPVVEPATPDAEDVVA